MTLPVGMVENWLPPSRCSSGPLLALNILRAVALGGLSRAVIHTSPVMAASVNLHLAAVNPPS